MTLLRVTGRRIIFSSAGKGAIWDCERAVFRTGRWRLSANRSPSLKYRTVSSSMAPQIRILNEPDAGELFRLRRTALLDSPLAFLASLQDDLASSEEATRELLTRAPESVVFGASTVQLVGMLGLYRVGQAKAAHKANLWGMFVLPAWRRQGLGALLLDGAIRYARSLHGVTSLHLSVSESASAARRLYERVGFETWGVEPDAIRFEVHSEGECHMRLPLNYES